MHSNLQLDLHVAAFKASFAFVHTTQKSQGASYTYLFRYHVCGFAHLALSGVLYVLGGRTDSGESKWECDSRCAIVREGEVISILPHSDQHSSY